MQLTLLQRTQMSKETGVAFTVARLVAAVHVLMGAPFQPIDQAFNL